MMTDSEKLRTIAINLAKAARDRSVISIAGGEFSGDELRLASVACVAAPDLLRGCQAAMAYLADPPSEFPENRAEAVRIIEAAIRAFAPS